MSNEKPCKPDGDDESKFAKGSLNKIGELQMKEANNDKAKKPSQETKKVSKPDKEAGAKPDNQSNKLEQKNQPSTDANE